MNTKQKLQVTLIILFAILLVFWIVFPGNIYARILGVISSALLILSMALSYRAEERNKNPFHGDAVRFDHPKGTNTFRKRKGLTHRGKNNILTLLLPYTLSVSEC